MSYVEVVEPRSLVQETQFCVRGCAQQHWAVCENLAPEELNKRDAAEDAGERYTPPCRGCAPSVCRAGSLVCDQCFGRARHILHDAPELLQRLRSMVDGGRSRWNWDRVVVSSSLVGAAATVGDDIIDAAHAIETALTYYRAGLASLTDDPEAMRWIGPLVLDDHPPVDGIRARWSIRDAMSRWGIESRDRSAHPDARPNAPRGAYARYDDEEHVRPVREWYDPLITLEQAAERRQASQRTMRRCAQNGALKPVAHGHGAAWAVRYFRASDVDAVQLRPPASTVDAEAARRMFDAGHFATDIAKQLDVPLKTVSKWAKQEGLSFPKGRRPRAADAER